MYSLVHFSGFCFSPPSVEIFNSQLPSESFRACPNMADSDRSRSPAPGRNRTEPRGQVHAPRPELPFFPRWRGPMNSSILHFQNTPRPQSRPQWATNRPGPYMMGRVMNPSQSMMQTNWSHHQFPPAPPPSIPPTLPYLPSSRQATPPCSPTMPCPPTQPCSPGTPSVPSSQPRPHETPSSTSPTGLRHHEATRTYGFDLNGRTTRITTTTRRSMD